MAQYKLSDLPDAVIDIIKQHVPTAHARTFCQDFNEDRTLLAITAIMFKENQFMTFVFGRCPDNQPAPANRSWVLYYNGVAGPVSDFIPQFSGNTLLLHKQRAIAFEYKDDAWFMEEVSPLTFDEPATPEPAQATYGQFTTDTSTKPKPKLMNRLVTKSSQPVDQIISLATMLGLVLVYEEENKLVFNRHSGLSPMFNPSTQFGPIPLPHPIRPQEYKVYDPNTMPQLFHQPPISLVVELVSDESNQ